MVSVMLPTFKFLRVTQQFNIILYNNNNIWYTLTIIKQAKIKENGMEINKQRRRREKTRGSSIGLNQKQK
jgi:hypothetical protein